MTIENQNININEDPPVEPSVEPVVWENYKSITDFYNRVRDVLFNTSITILSDAQIDMPEKAPSADRYIKRLVPKWKEFRDSETEEDKEKFEIFKSCIVYQTGIYFETYVKRKQPKSMKSSSINIEYSTSGNIKDTPMYTLVEMLNDLLAQLSEPTGAYLGFRVTNSKE